MKCLPKSCEEMAVSQLECLSNFGVKAMHDYRRMLAINGSCFLEGTHFAITPIQPKFSANQERVEFLVFTLYCLKTAIALQVLQMFGKEEWGIIRNISLGHSLASLVGDGRNGFILKKQCLRNIISNMLLKLKARLIRISGSWAT